MGTLITPSEVSLSPRFKLSDLIGSTSVYARGLVNAPTEAEFTDHHLRQGQTLCETMLEPMLDEFGPLSITYGYITPAASRAIVRYQDPNLPSYHRWDKGSAADVYIHAIDADLHHDSWENAPLAYALTADYLKLPYSRIITYSESPVFCVATEYGEVDAGEPRKAFYENRYEGKPGVKPRHVKLMSATRREAMLDELPDLDYRWRGGGFPSYHGTKQRQMHHCRVSRYSVLTDWLYDDRNLQAGTVNRPGEAAMRSIIDVATRVHTALITGLALERVSLTQGYLTPQALRAHPDRPTWHRHRVWEHTDTPVFEVHRDSLSHLDTARIRAAVPEEVRVYETERGYAFMG